MLLAEDGFDALAAKINDHHPSLIFCDIVDAAA